MKSMWVMKSAWNIVTLPSEITQEGATAEVNPFRSDPNTASAAGLFGSFFQSNSGTDTILLHWPPDEPTGLRFETIFYHFQTGIGLRQPAAGAGVLIGHRMVITKQSYRSCPLPNFIRGVKGKNVRKKWFLAVRHL